MDMERDPKKIKIVTRDARNVWGPLSRKTAGDTYRLGYNRTPIGNGIWGIKWSHDR